MDNPTWYSLETRKNWHVRPDNYDNLVDQLIVATELMIAVVPLQAGNKLPACEWNSGYLPIASSMMLIWLSEGDRIFGGLSVRGAVEWQTETKMLKMATFFFSCGLCVYDESIRHKIKAALKMNTAIWKNSDWTEVSDELLWWINHPHQGLNSSAWFFFVFVFY